MPKPTALLRLVAAACLLAAALPQAAGAQDQGAWQWQITPFALAPSIEGTTELGSPAGDVSIDAGDVFDQLQAGGMLQFEGFHASNFGFRLRYGVLDADSTRSSAGSAVPLRYDQNLGEAVVGYRFGSTRNRFEVFGGLRHWDVDTVADLPGGTLRQGGSWSDPIAGLRWQRRLSPEFSVLLEGDVGFAGDSEESWSAMGGLVYDRWERASIYLLYRGLGVEYEEGTRGTGTFFRHDAVTHSLLAGVGFRF
ncbi:hypothetical protein [Leisingera sp. ANG-Vp]|uniref:hypothetical protein n=1 Tax=Leisingera sp. ANG-Vp TaxID=1577896 RepID=UPI00057DF729|nr:hypothetical protein [Leisingera sp. ANG-Vp]KIC20894.1 hypothetical protein RA20_06405 [Leisingera sp. ANG-Vp]